MIAQQQAGERAFSTVALNPSVDSAAGFMTALSSRPDVLARVQEDCLSIDINKTICSMELVGELLQVAYAGSIGYDCNNHILGILTCYMPVVKQTRLTVGKCVKGSLDALQNIRDAVELVNAGEYEDALQVFKENADLASGFATEAAALETECNKICDLAKVALLLTNEDATKTIKEREAMEAKKKAEEVKKAEFEAKKLRLERDLAELKKEEERIMTGWDEERQREHTLAMTNAITLGIGNIVSSVASAVSSTATNLVRSIVGGAAPAAPAPKEAPAVADTDMTTFANLISKSREQRMLLIQMEAEAVGSLAAALQEIKNAQECGDKLASSVKSLEASVKALGQVSVVFANVKQYWTTVASTCKEICDNGVKVSGTLQRLQNGGARPTALLMMQVEKYAKTWCGLAFLSISAQGSIQRTDETIDRVLGNLPNESEVPRIVNGIAGLIQRIANISPQPSHVLLEDVSSTTSAAAASGVV